MTRISSAALALALGLAAALPATAALASDGPVSEEVRARLTEKLKAEGYEVRKLEAEDGLVEAYALKDGKRYELYMDPRTGEVVKSKMDD